MSFATLLSSIDNTLRPLLTPLPSKLYTAVYSYTRPWFSKISSNDLAFEQVVVPSELAIKISGISFRSPLGNAAGMYKHAEGYMRSYKQGAGFYLAGTTTSLPRIGNSKSGIKHPFVPYPHTHAASNWLGLPNAGHKATSSVIKGFPRFKDFPIAASVSADPGMNSNKALQGLLDGLLYYTEAECQFLELNESCPNVESHHANSQNVLDSELLQRLDRIAQQYIMQNGALPIFVKFSNDTALHQVEPLIHALLERGFAGVNFGNTSIQYNAYKKEIDAKDKRTFEYFTREFGGGLSGNILRESALALCNHAKHVLQENKSSLSFSIICTGGIENSKDMLDSALAGAALMQWYTGYYEKLGIDGNNLYGNIYREYSRIK